MISEGRDKTGRFAQGNTGGPGRPKRSVERHYLAALGDAVSLDAWRAIVDRAVADAQAGDHSARMWLAKYLIGNDPPTLLSLAVAEQRNITPDDDVEALRVEQQKKADLLARLEAARSSL
jgi:hypothetical protein